jgi:hypothetical protein
VADADALSASPVGELRQAHGHRFVEAADLALANGDADSADLAIENDETSESWSAPPP